MGKSFMDMDFLLSGEIARRLYHGHATNMPIIDYHCHIDPQQIYEDKVNGSLSEKRFEILSAEYENEQAELEQSIENLQAELNGFNADGVRADRFIEIVKRHTDFSELTAPMINEFVEKIIVHEADRSSGEREQKVDIYLNFIGRFEVPEITPAPEDIAVEEQAREKRARHREAQRRYAGKQKQQSV